MAKHEKWKCHKCGEEESKSYLSPLFGCRKCKAAMPEAERSALLTAFNQRRGDDLAEAAEASKIARQRGFDTTEGAKAIHDRIMRHKATEDAVTAALERQCINPLCECCLDYRMPGVTFTETFDGKWFCPRCAYGVVKTGHCTLHRTTHYPEVAAVTPPLAIDDYPDDVLAPFPKAMFK